MNPTSSPHPQYYFTCHGVALCIALFSADFAAQPEVVYPALLRQTGASTWEVLDKREPMWSDIKETIDPATMLDLIINDFNLTIAGLSGQPAETYEQKLARLLTTKVTVVNNQLVLS